MKVRLTLLAAASASAAAGGFLSVAHADYQGDCSKDKPVSVYTDDLAHYAGVCVGENKNSTYYVQVNELSSPPESLVEGGKAPKQHPEHPEHPEKPAKPAKS